MNSDLLIFSGVLPSPKPNIYGAEDPNLPKLSTHGTDGVGGFADASADGV